MIGDLSDGQQQRFADMSVTVWLVCALTVPQRLYPWHGVLSCDRLCCYVFDAHREDQKHPSPRIICETTLPFAFVQLQLLSQ
jgi:hypothetical protein